MSRFVPPETFIGGVSQGRLPERQLIYGTEGSGKTFAWLTVAKMCHDLGDPAQFWVADSDAAVPRSMSNTFSELTNVHVTDILQFRDYMEWTVARMEDASPGDYLVVDTASAGYELAQEYFFEAKYKMSRTELELERMFDPTWKSGAPLIEPEDWVAIRNMFLNWWTRLVVQKISVAKGVHVIATAEAKQLMEHHEKKKKDKSNLIDYSELGYRPAGHQSLPHKVHTVAMMRRIGTGFYWNPVKDRERPNRGMDDMLKHMKIENYAIDYLMGRCGWEVVD